MASDLVSIVVPAYNAARYLKETLESVFSQTYRNYEVIVVDDGSTDDTPQIAQQFGASIRYIHQPNHGLSAARNTAIKNARAEIIALLDSDDLWEPEFLEKMIPRLNSHPEAAGAYCGFQYIDSKGEVVGYPSLRVVQPELFHSTMVDEGNWLVPCSVIFRKQLAETVGLFDETLHAVEDLDLWIRLSAHAPFVGLSEALVKYRRHENNMSKDPERMVKANFQLCEKLVGPPEGDLSSWSERKRNAYRKHYWYAATSYLAFGDESKSTQYLRLMTEISPELMYSIAMWRGMIRAHLPDEFQFMPSLQLDLERSKASIDRVLDRLVQETSQSRSLNGQYARMRGFAYLALADEAGRAKESSRAYVWLWKAISYYFGLLFSRPFWGTMIRVLSAH